VNFYPLLLLYSHFNYSQSCFVLSVWTVQSFIIMAQNIEYKFLPSKYGKQLLVDTDNNIYQLIKKPKVVQLTTDVQSGLWVVVDVEY
jgi:hypothetical protein